MPEPHSSSKAGQPVKLSSRSAALSEALLGQIKIARHSPFLRDVFVVGGGTAAAQGIAIVFLPIISRLYSPETFGYYNLLVTSTLLLVPLATLRHYAFLTRILLQVIYSRLVPVHFQFVIPMAI